MKVTGSTITVGALVLGLIVGGIVGYNAAASLYSDSTQQILGSQNLVAWYAAIAASLSIMYDVVQEMRFQKWRSTVNRRLDL